LTEIAAALFKNGQQKDVTTSKTENKEEIVVISNALKAILGVLNDSN